MRLTLFLALFFGVGGAAFRLLADTLPPQAHRTSSVLIALGLFAAVVSVGLQGADALGLSLSALFQAKTWLVGFSTAFGATSIVSVATLALGYATLKAKGRASATMFGGLALAGVGLAICMSGHASAANPQWLMKPALFMHVTAIAWWAGALFPLVLLLSGSRQAAAPPLIRFSRAIPFAIVPLVTSGIILAAVQLGWPGPSWATAYGLILALKLVLLVALFGIASWNRWVLTGPAALGKLRAVTHMRRGILAEILLIFAVLGLVSAWRFTPPPRALAATNMMPATVELAGRNVAASLSITPPRTGTADISILVSGSDGATIAPRSVVLSLEQPSLGIEGIERSAVLAADQTWRIEEIAIPASGEWSVEVRIRISDFELARLSGTVRIAP